MPKAKKPSAKKLEKKVPLKNKLTKIGHGL
jgi:hypothetical protein